MIYCLSMANKPKHQWLSIGLLAVLYFPVVAFAQVAPRSAAETPQATPTPEHQPAQPPSVTFHDDDLTIVAYNSTLHDVLEMVCKQTGASLDIPDETNERVFVKLGPGPARRVLDSLLAGSSFNYILLGSASDPQALTKVVLSAKPSGNTDNAGGAEVITAAQRRPGRRPGQSQPQAEEELEPAAAPIPASEIVAEGQVPAAAAKTENASIQGKTEAAAGFGNQPPAESAQAAAGNPELPADYPRTPNIRTAQEVLQDLYSRRQAMQQQTRPQTTPQ